MEAFIRLTEVELTARLTENSILAKLYSESILTTDQYDDIGDLSTRANRKKFMDIMRRKSKAVISRFIAIIAECTAGQGDLIAYLYRVKESLEAQEPSLPSPSPMSPLFSPPPSSGKTFLNLASGKTELFDFPQQPNTSSQAGGQHVGTDSGLLKSSDSAKSFLQPYSPALDNKMETDAIPITDSMIYPLKSNPTGHVLLINNISFLNNTDMERTGAQKDTQRLAELFRDEFKMNVYSQTNVTSNNFGPTLTEFKALFKESPADVSIVVVMSHGDNRDRILTSDQASLQIYADILQQFNNQHFQHMIGKPKIFIFQSCRGDTLDRGTLQTDSVPYSSTVKLRIPTWTDMLVCYSTLEGHYAYRDTIQGSWFIQILCDVFKKYASQLDICRMLNIVGEKMKEKEGDAGEKQICPWTNIGFTKEFYLISKKH